MAKSIAHKPEKRRSWRRFIVYLIVLVLAFLAGGFLTFANTVENQERPSPVPKADGIVVWTGKGGGRLEAGADLLEDNRAERLLISGVNENNDRAEMFRVLGLDSEMYDGRVDLDYEARDTVGNARETSNWAEAMGYEHIILVTSAYHMPRAEIEIAASHSRIHITPYPVLGDSDKRWWNDTAQFKRMSQEYGKLLLTYVRRMGGSSKRSAPVLEDIPEASLTDDSVSE